jgi:hypothetical protein
MASSSIERTVDLGSLGSAGRSATVHLNEMFGEGHRGICG